VALETELRAKRVPPAVIAVLRGPDDGTADEHLTEDDRADAALERHLKGRPLPEDPRALQRLGMFLVRRGFDPATARSALRRRGADR
jgi:SOS response regulatory protein OraA/RecX